MSLYYIRGGFHAAVYDIDSTGLTEHQKIQRNFIAELIALFTASRKDATARGAGYTQYWDFDASFFDGVASGVTGYTAADMCGSDTTLLNDFLAVTSRQSGNICVRANTDTTLTHPCYGTVLKGQGGEYLYMCWCNGVRVATSEVADTGYGLVIHANNARAAGAAQLHDAGSLHLWYCPDPTYGGAAIYPFGAVHPGKSGFIANDKRLWMMDCGFAISTTSNISPGTNTGFLVEKPIRHAVMCKEDIVLLGAKNNGSATNDYSWVLFGQNIVELASTGTGAPGAFSLQSSSSLATSVYMADDLFLSSRQSSDMNGYYTGVKSHYADNVTAQTSGSYAIRESYTILSNRLASQPIPISPIAVMVYPTVGENLITSDCTLINGQSLVGYLRGDIARSVIGWGLAEYTSFDNGNYLVAHSSGSQVYDGSRLKGCNRLLLGWDPSNTVVL